MVSASILATVLAVAAAPDVTLVSFSADWCGVCQTAKPVVQRLVQDGYPVREVNVDRERELVARFQITSVPSFVLLVDGREVERVAESASYARLAQMFDRVGYRRPVSPGSAGPAEPLVRGQSADPSGEFGLPKPLAALARNFGQPSQPLPQDSTQPATPAVVGGVAGSRVGSQELALRATVRLRIDDLKGHSVGTGTIIDTHGEEALVITCGHLFRDSSGKGRIAVDVFADGQPRTVNGTLISYDLERDLGFVAIPAPLPLSAVRVAPTGFRFERGQAVFSVGCDRAADPTVQSTRITGIDRYVGPPNIEVAGQPVEGRSGGGLFSVAGELIGVCNAADPSDNEGIFASLPAVHWELDRIGQRRIYEPQPSTADPKSRELAAAEPRRSAPASSPLPASAPAALSTQPPTRTAVAFEEPAHTGGIAAQPPRPAVAIQSVPPGHRPASQPLHAPQSGDTEVICIVRSRANPQTSQQLIILDRPSRDLLDRLAAESQVRPAAVTMAQQPLPANPPPAGLPGQFEPAASPIVRAQSDGR